MKTFASLWLIYFISWSITNAAAMLLSAFLDVQKPEAFTVICATIAFSVLAGICGVLHIAGLYAFALLRLDKFLAAKESILILYLLFIGLAIGVILNLYPFGGTWRTSDGAWTDFRNGQLVLEALANSLALIAPCLIAGYFTGRLWARRRLSGQVNSVLAS